MATAQLILCPGNAQYIEVDGVADGLSVLNPPIAYKNDCTVTATLYDVNGAQVPGVIALPLAFVASSSGVYRGLVPASFNPVLTDPFQPQATDYTLTVLISEAGTALGRLDLPVTVAVRTS